ncbi:MAG: valine--tRNA ligase [Candidatus Methylomirabilales bacterium]
MTEGSHQGYEPREVEARWYTFWEARGYFHADENSLNHPYCIVIPPPNVTGSLHMGHALNNTLQDILIRWRRMQGYNSLWMPGTDHAGIATQNVVEKQLAREGLSRYHIGRHTFIERVWKWKAESGGTIIRQLKQLGASCDWVRECFTMDPPRSRAVTEVFVRLFEDGLLYRAERLVNWCPRCQTALADIEVVHEEVEGHLWSIRYPFAEDPRNGLVVATTRPETMLGDAAVAVHPEDLRYRDVVGRTVLLPMVGRKLPVIADRAVAKDFGTGALKVTPGHDPSDYEIGARHGLRPINAFDEKGRITGAFLVDDAGERIENAQAQRYVGGDRYEVRRNILEDLRTNGLLVKEESHRHAVGHCYRCHTVIEPFLAPQWFIRVKPLAEPAIRVVEAGRVRIIPDQWERNYFDWMHNIRDWCISRQIWWGHRIPAWYCLTCDAANIVKTAHAVGFVEEGGRPPQPTRETYIFLPEAQPIVAREKPHGCPRCGGRDLVQDPDVLDTWFSSALWPFSTLGWPENTSELRTFYPTSVLVTGFDILFFWVARMIMMGLRFMGEVPFRQVYIHALVRDEEGAKMSKSRGNVIDPLTVIDKYGADALRFTLAALAAQGRDMKLSEDRIEGYRLFCNKVWNAHRFVAMHLTDGDRSAMEAEPVPPRSTLDLTDRWLMSRLQDLVDGVTKALEEFRFNDAAGQIYQFLWHEYCDWYLELVKSRIVRANHAPDPAGGRRLLVHGLEVALRLLHPFMPFLSEAIWQQLPRRGESLTIAPWPEPDPAWRDPEAVGATETMMEVIRAIRNIRSETRIPPSTWLTVQIRAHGEAAATIQATRHYILALARAERVEVDAALTRPTCSAHTVVREMEIYIPLTGVIDVTKELSRLERELQKTEKEFERLTRKLANEDFLRRAPDEVVAKEQAKLQGLRDTREKLKAHREMLRAEG